MRWGIVLAACLSGCMYFDSSNDEQRCENQACTDLFAMITVQIVDESNAPATGLTTRSTYADGNVPIMTYQDPIDNGTYVVVDDNFLGQALPDRIHHTINFQASSGPYLTATATYVVAAGECTCHVTKVSGPDMLVLKFGGAR